jgi:hypothetical protein
LIPRIDIDKFTHAEVSFTIFINIRHNCGTDERRILLSNLAKCSFFSIWETKLHKIAFKWGSDCTVDRLRTAQVKQYKIVAPITLNHWCFVVVTSDRQRHINNIYIDGREQKTVSRKDGFSGHRHPMTLGCFSDGKNSFFLGLMSRLMMFPYMLGKEQIRSMFRRSLGKETCSEQDGSHKLCSIFLVLSHTFGYLEPIAKKFRFSSI